VVVPAALALTVACELHARYLQPVVSAVQAVRQCVVDVRVWHALFVIDFSYRPRLMATRTGSEEEAAASAEAEAEAEAAAVTACREVLRFTPSAPSPPPPPPPPPPVVEGAGAEDGGGEDEGRGGGGKRRGSADGCSALHLHLLLQQHLLLQGGQRHVHTRSSRSFCN
jgi:hypothetical protein